MLTTRLECFSAVKAFHGVGEFTESDYWEIAHLKTDPVDCFGVNWQRCGMLRVGAYNVLMVNCGMDVNMVCILSMNFAIYFNYLIKIIVMPCMKIFIYEKVSLNCLLIKNFVSDENNRFINVGKSNWEEEISFVSKSFLLIFLRFEI